MKLELALLKLTETSSFDQIVFWGKIEGIKSDYYIAQGLNFKEQYEFPKKVFFWCGQDFNFAEFPALKEEFADRVDQFRGLFVGQHNRTLIQASKVEEVAEEVPQDQEGEKIVDELISVSEVEEKPPPQPFNEIDRLVFTVRAIEVDCQSVPIGAYKMTPSHEMRYDDEFKGLSIKNSNSLSFYQHFRNPQTTEKRDMMSKFLQQNKQITLS
jgi:radial spoke head protein 9